MRDSRDLREIRLAPEHFPQAWEALRAGVAEGVAPGFVAGLWRKSRPGEFVAASIGHRRLLPSAQPMETSTVFDLASVSKVFATASLAALLVQRGWLAWDTPLAAILPGFRGARDTRLGHLLSHTAGLTWWEPYWERLRARFAPTELHRVPVADRQAAMRELVYASPPAAGLGERAVYSDLSFLLLGFALEEVTRLPLDAAVRTLLWEPMGIRDAYYRRVDAAPDAARQDAVAATEACGWRGGVLQGQPHDDNCWAMGGYAGHAGAFASVRELMQFARAWFDGFFAPGVREAAWRRVARPAGCERTLGWDTPSGEAPSASREFSARSVGHLGFTGTSLWLDPDAELAVALLSNRVHPSRDNSAIRAFRPRFHAALRRDLAALATGAEPHA